MPDTASITSVLAGIQHATELATLIRDSSLSLEQGEVKSQLAELIAALAETKAEIANIQNRIEGKSDCISCFHEITSHIQEMPCKTPARPISAQKKKNGICLLRFYNTEVSGKIIYEAPYYFLIDGKNKDGPYCQKCYDAYNKLTVIHPVYNEKYLKCTECGTSYIHRSYIKLLPMLTDSHSA